MSYHAALGAACPPCTLWTTGGCIPCPNGAPDPECQGCVGGRSTSSDWFATSSFWGPVLISAAAAVAGSIALVMAARIGLPAEPSR